MLKKKIIIRLLLFLIGFVFIDQTIGSVLIAPYPYNRQAKSDEKNESYHTIFIGASKILVGIDPAIIEEYWEAGGVYNAGTASQRINATFYYLQDLIKNNEVENVVLGMTYRAYHADYSLDSFPDNYAVYSRLTDSSIKMEFKKNVLVGVKQRYMGFLNAFRYAYTRHNNFSWKLRQLKYWITQPENGEYINGMAYQRRGYCTMEGVVEIGSLGICSVEPWDSNRISAVAMEYLDKIVKLCKENEIELTLIVPPSANAYIYAVDERMCSYDEINSFFENYAESKDIKFYNFNLSKLKAEELSDEHFADARHLNKEGAEIFSKYVGQVMSAVQSGQNISDFFFASFEEMRRNMNYVVCAEIELSRSEGKVSLRAITLQEEDMQIEYQFLGYGDNGEWEVLQEYSQESMYNEEDTHLNYRVNVRAQGSHEAYEAFAVAQ